MILFEVIIYHHDYGKYWDYDIELHYHNSNPYSFESHQIIDLCLIHYSDNHVDNKSENAITILTLIEDTLGESLESFVWELLLEYENIFK